jgi:hypothetical protein
LIFNHKAPPSVDALNSIKENSPFINRQNGEFGRDWESWRVEGEMESKII